MKDILNKLFGGSILQAEKAAKEYEKDGNLEMAIQILEEVSKKHPEKKQMQKHVRELKVEKAPNDIIKAEKIINESGDNLGALEKAEALLRDSLSVPGNHQALALVLEAKLEEKIKPLKIAKYLDLTKAKCRLKQYEDARKLLTEIIKLSPTNEEIDDLEKEINDALVKKCISKALQVKRKGNIDDAIVKLQTARIIDTKNEVARKLLSDFQAEREIRNHKNAVKDALSEEKWAIALAESKILVEITRSNPEPVKLRKEVINTITRHYQSTISWYKEGHKIDSALKEIEMFHSILPKSEDVPKQREALLKLKTQARQLYRQAGDNYREGDYRSAEKTLEEALSINSEMTNASYLLKEIRKALTVIEDDVYGKDTTVIRKKEVIIGRSTLKTGRYFDISYPSLDISSKGQSMIVYQHGSFCLLDKKSRSGTYINGIKIMEKKLKDGDTIGFGHIVKVHFKQKGNMAKLILRPVNIDDFDEKYMYVAENINRQTGHIYIIIGLEDK